MLRVPVIKNNLNKALKIFKKKFKSTKLIKEIRERQQYTKKSTKKSSFYGRVRIIFIRMYESTLFCW